jgi:hypothetical protein
LFATDWELINMAGRAPIIPKQVKNTLTPSEEQIRKRAHELYLERGCQDGLALEDWLQAEAELRLAMEPDAKLLTTPGQHAKP